MEPKGRLSDVERQIRNTTHAPQPNESTQRDELKTAPLHKFSCCRTSTKKAFDTPRTLNNATKTCRNDTRENTPTSFSNTCS